MLCLVDGVNIRSEGSVVSRKKMIGETNSLEKEVIDQR
jgi:hypothetical protein